jgi:hypothetical protein
VLNGGVVEFVGWIAVALVALGTVLVVVGVVMAWREHSKLLQSQKDLNEVAEVVKSLTEFARALSEHPLGVRIVLIGVLLILVGAVLSLALLGTAAVA